VIDLSKPTKKRKVNKTKDNKQEIPVLKSPAESRAGRIIIWIILVAMVLGAIGGLVAAIILGAK
jgi:small-conductance mechanosensitive channel